MSTTEPTKQDFHRLIKKAATTDVTKLEKRAESLMNNEKQTRQRKTVSTLAKRRGTSR